MELIPTDIPDVKVLLPKKHGDHRGFFSEVFNDKNLAAVGIASKFVQDNHSLSVEKGVVRGLHYQLNPMAQEKLIRVIKGAILDVAVDIRKNSPTFGQHVAVEISAMNWKQIFVPTGFAHGFVTLEPNTEVIYKVTNYYSPQHERGIRWNDPKLGIAWGIDHAAATLNKRDSEFPVLSEATDLF